MEMTIRISKLENGHLRIVARLLNVEYKDSYGFIPFDQERVLLEIKRRDLKVLVAEEEGHVLGFIGTRLEEGNEENILWFAAESGPSKRVIENILLNEIEKTAKSNTITATVDEGSPKTKEWIDRGFALCPGWVRMSSKLDGLKQVSEVPEGVKLRSLERGEEEELVEVMNAGFSALGRERLVLGDLNTWKSLDAPFNENWVQVAEFAGKIVSAVVAKPDTDFNKLLGLSRGCLGPATTLPEFRNKHLASALAARAMNFLFEKGMNSVRASTSEQNTASIAVLRSLDFHVDNIRKRLRKELAIDQT
jgi:ribosomal protein S18 acetylase RimI-like enzyme